MLMMMNRYFVGLLVVSLCAVGAYFSTHVVHADSTIDLPVIAGSYVARDGGGQIQVLATSTNPIHFKAEGSLALAGTASNEKGTQTVVREGDMTISSEWKGSYRYSEKPACTLSFEFYEKALYVSAESSCPASGAQFAGWYYLDTGTNSSSSTNGFTETIHDFQTNITVSPDARAHFIEQISYDFGSLEKHGITRNIPKSNAVGTVGKLRLTGFYVTDEKGNPYTLQGSYDAPDTSSMGLKQLIFGTDSMFTHGDGDYALKVGDADTLITGNHIYQISYDADNALGFFPDRDEIYWNVTGNGWEAQIEKASAIITLPAVIPEDQLHLQSYCGEVGNTAPCAVTSVMTSTSTNTTTVTFTANRILNSYEGMTVAVGFPKGLVKDLSVGSAPQHPWYEWLQYWFIPVPLLIFLYQKKRAIAYLVRRRRYHKNRPIVAQYDADSLSPLQASALSYGYPRKKDLSAEIVWLAVAGYLKITKKDDDTYSFKRNTPKQVSPVALLSYSEALLSGIADETTESLEDSFYLTASTIQEDAMESLVSQGYREASPVKKGVFGRMKKDASMRTNWGWSFVLLFFAVNPGTFIWAIFGSHIGFIFSGWCVVTALLGGFLRHDYLTNTGLEEEWKLLGLKKYIEVAEKDRIAFHDAPEKTPEIFEKLLPFAMVFNLEKKWAAEFENIYTERPDWYSSSDTAAFSAGYFASEMGSFASTTSSAITSAPSSSGSSGSSGGGSSGGGGGGGGGGSW